MSPKVVEMPGYKGFAAHLAKLNVQQLLQTHLNKEQLIALNAYMLLTDKNDVECMCEAITDFLNTVVLAKISQIEKVKGCVV